MEFRSSLRHRPQSVVVYLELGTERHFWLTTLRVMGDERHLRPIADGTPCACCYRERFTFGRAYLLDLVERQRIPLTT